MNRNKLTELLLHPDKVTSRDAAMLAEMADQYPYAGVLHILRAKSGQGRDNERLFLGTAALYTPNRQILRLVMENKLPALPGNAAEADELANSPQVASGPVTDQLQEKPDTQQQQQHEETETGESAAYTGTAPSTAPTEETDEEETQPADNPNVFEELQENLRRLRESRTKSYEAEKESPETSVEDKELNRPATSETLEQLVKDHQAQTPDNPRVKHQRNLIDSFLQNGAQLPRRQLQNQPPAEEQITDLSQQATFTPPDLATETLAQIMERQGKAEKAIDIYQKLILKYPQKSAYFADCIERLKKN